MALKLQNNAISRLATGIGPSDTLISITPGDGAKFPTLGDGDWCPLTLLKADGSLEIVRCTARTSDTLTIERAQEGTSAQAFEVNDRVELRITAATLNYFWSPSNQGSGSGLDADTLDGRDAAVSAVPDTLVARDAQGGASFKDIEAEDVEADHVEANTVDADVITATDKFVGDVEGKADEAETAKNLDGGTVNATTVKSAAYTEKQVTVPSSGPDAYKIDLTKGNHFRVVVSGTAPISLNGAPESTDEIISFTLEVVNGGSAVIWPANTLWSEGEAPDLTTTGTDVIGFKLRGGSGTNKLLMGFLMGRDMKASV